MAQITRSSIILRLHEWLGIQVAAAKSITSCADFIQPVAEVGPRTTTIWRSGTTTSTGSTTIFTTPTDKDFYLTYANIASVKDATNDNTEVSILATISGISTRILTLQFQSVTAFSDHIQQNFSYPLKVDRGTNIVISGIFSLGTMTKRGNIGGFILE